MSNCRVFVRWKGRLAFVRREGDLSFPLLKVNAEGKEENGLEELIGASKKLITNDELETILVDADDTYPLPLVKGNEPIWIDERTVTDQAIGLIARAISFRAEDMDLVRRNFTLLNV